MMRGEHQGMNFKFEGFLIEHDTTPRSFEARDPARSPNTRAGVVSPANCVLDLLLADRTGPIPMSLWHGAATEFLEKLSHYHATRARTSGLKEGEGGSVGGFGNQEWRCL